jgi:hypothetical protein
MAVPLAQTGLPAVLSELIDLTLPLDAADMLRVCGFAAESFRLAGRFDPAIAPLASVRAFPGDQRRATSAWIRLECLAGLIADPRMRAWHAEGSCAGGPLRLNDRVYEAAASEPVLSDDPDGRAPYFDADAFFARLLAMSRQAGEG